MYNNQTSCDGFKYITQNQGMDKTIQINDKYLQTRNEVDRGTDSTVETDCV